MTITPRGESFLPNISIDELNGLYQKETDPIVKIRLLAAILRKKGKTLLEISLAVKHPLTTVGDWLRRLHTEGISRKNNKKQSGRPKRLTDKQIEDLKPILFKSPHEQGFPFIIWTTKLVIQLIEKLYNVSYKPLQVRRILHRLGLSCQKPRPSHRKANKHFEDNLIRAMGDYKVYLVVNGIKRHIPNPEIFLDYGFSWTDIKDVPQETVNKYSQARLVRESKQGKIYYLSGVGKKKWILTLPPTS